MSAMNPREESVDRRPLYSRWPPQIIVINRKKCRSRITKVMEELDKVGLGKRVYIMTACEPVEAKKSAHVYAKPKTLYNILTKRDCDSPLISSYNALACAMSHRKAWSKLEEMGLKEAIIVEDDFVVGDVFKLKSHIGWLYHAPNCASRDPTGSPVSVFCSLGSSPCTYDVYDSFVAERDDTWRYTVRSFTREMKIGPDFASMEEHLFSPVEIEGPFCGLHFYYLTSCMARLLRRTIHKVQYQIDVEIGRLCSPMNNRRRVFDPNSRTLANAKFYMFSDNSAGQNASYLSDIQPWRPVGLSSHLNRPADFVQSEHRHIRDMYACIGNVRICKSILLYYGCRPMGLRFMLRR